MEIIKSIKNIKKIELEDILCIYIVLCPILDIASFLFRNNFNTNISISTFLRPIIPICMGIYIFIKANKKNKLILLGIMSIYFLYGIAHLLATKTFITGCSYGGVKQELQYVINYSFLIVNLIVFYYAFTNKKWRNNKKDKKYENNEKQNESKNKIEKLKIAILVMCGIYIVSIYIAILTGTSSYTYKQEQIGYKGWIESGNSLGAILCIGVFLILSLIKNKKYRIISIIIIALIGIYLVALIGTRTGLIGFFLAVAVFITIEVIFSKNKVAIVGFVILAIAVITVGLVGSNTLKRRSQMNESQYQIIDESTGEVGHMTGDMLRIKNKILAGTLDEGYMSDPQQKAVLDLNEYATKNKIAGNDTRKQQLIYNIYLVKEQKSLLGIIFGNGFETNFREMIMENELASLLLNFGIIGFILYAGPFALILIYSIIVAIKKIKNKESLKTDYLMNIAALFLIFALSYLSGYIFFNSSLMIIIAAISVTLINGNKIEENNNVQEVI